MSDTTDGTVYDAAFIGEMTGLGWRMAKLAGPVADGGTLRNMRAARDRFREVAPEYRRDTIVNQLASYTMQLRATDDLIVVRHDGSVWALRWEGADGPEG